MISDSVIRCEFLSVKPHTPHPTPYTPHPTPHTPHPTPYTPHPTPHTLHPTPHTPHPTPYTPHPTPTEKLFQQTLIRAAIPVKFPGSYLYERGNFGLEYRQLNVN
ncbi:hypothetical protein [Microcystis aeruginosa]|uniref:hypothetical protein n=1 Tax=Microcystis aeruginosa TaxID=1126 RepID=UPI0018EF2019|nr:hypothetical protein [Microcystis aeruginosa]